MRTFSCPLAARRPQHQMRAPLKPSVRPIYGRQANHSRFLIQRILRPEGFQRTMFRGVSDDALERQAERIADTVMDNAVENKIAVQEHQLTPRGKFTNKRQGESFFVKDGNTNSVFRLGDHRPHENALCNAPKNEAKCWRYEPV